LPDARDFISSQLISSHLISPLPFLYSRAATAVGSANPYLLIMLIFCVVKPPLATTGINEANVPGFSDTLKPV
jgi:hypothetical protein